MNAQKEQWNTEQVDNVPPECPNDTTQNFSITFLFLPTTSRCNNAYHTSVRRVDAAYMRALMLYIWCVMDFCVCSWRFIRLPPSEQRQRSQAPFRHECTLVVLHSALSVLAVRTDRGAQIGAAASPTRSLHQMKGDQSAANGCRRNSRHRQRCRHNRRSRSRPLPVRSRCPAPDLVSWLYAHNAFLIA